MLCQKTCDVPFGITAIVKVPVLFARGLQSTKHTLTKHTKTRTHETRKNRSVSCVLCARSFGGFRGELLIGSPQLSPTDSRIAARCHPAPRRARAPGDRRRNP